MEPINITYNDEPKLSSDIVKKEGDFVSREFMKYYALKQPITDVAYLPANPSNFYEQIQFAEIAGVFSLYIYISNSWKKVTLT